MLTPSSNLCWTEDRVRETVTPAYIHSHLRPNEQEILKRPLYFGNDLTDNNYLDWVLTKAQRFFLILVATGVPEQIFGVVDDSFDDDDLPVAEAAVADLRLAPEADVALDRRFYRTQFKFLTRVLVDGEHIRYADEETVPVSSVGLRSALSKSRDAADTVKLAGNEKALFVRKRVNLGSQLTEEQILTEIADMKRFSHDHVVSVFGSYVQNGIFNILSTPAMEYTLKAFLMDLPKSFEALPKSKRRKILITWPHCLASALAWLHSNKGHHGCIFPTNIHVTNDFNISLGPLDGESVLCITFKESDIEAYQYGPPERWKRAVTTVQGTGSQMTLPSGGRQGNRVRDNINNPRDPSSRRSGSSNGTSAGARSLYTFFPASNSEFARFRLSVSADASMSVPPRSKMRQNTTQSVGSVESSSTNQPRAQRSLDPGRRPPSVSSSNSSDKGRHRIQGIFLAAPESRTAVVQTWKSVEHDSFAADVFSLGAVTLDILTVLCKRTYSSFTRHRSARNRNAGRGGGLADASFHANLAQVSLWAQTLTADAQKRSKKDDSEIFATVGPLVQVAMQCLERSPEQRPKSDVLQRRLGEHLEQFAKIDKLHCNPAPPTRLGMPRYGQHPHDKPTTPSLLGQERSHSRPRETPIPEEDATVILPLTPNLSARPVARPMAPASSPPAVSLTSLPSMSLDIDSRSHTAVDVSVGSPAASVDHRRNNTERERGMEIWSPSSSFRKPTRWENNISSESAVDPRLTISTDASDGGIFTYMNYSTSGSEDGDGSTYRYPMPPTAPPPQKDLPQVPMKSSNRPSEQPAPMRKLKSPPPVTRKHPTKEEMAMLRQLSGAVTGEHPLRISSLSPNDRRVDPGEDVDRLKERLHRQAELPLRGKHHDTTRSERMYRGRV